MIQEAVFKDGVKRPILYEHGYPYSQELSDEIDRFIDGYLEKNEVCCIVIDGMSGKGKTTQGVHITDQINKRYGQLPMDLKTGEQIGLGGADFQRKLLECQKKSFHACIYDEAGDFGKRTAMTKFNIMLARMWDTFRAFKIIPIICIPLVKSLDNTLIERGLVKMLIHNYRKHDAYIDWKAYDKNSIHYLITWMKKTNAPPEQVYHATWCNFQGHTLRLSPEREEALDKLSMAGKKDLNQSIRINLEGMMSIDDLHKNLGKSIPWVRKAIYAAGIIEKDVIKNKKYYAKETLQILKNRIGG